MGNSSSSDKEEDEVFLPSEISDRPSKTENGFYPTDSDDLVAKQKLAEIKQQNHDQIRETCLRTKELWEDPLFPAENYSIYRDGRPRFRVKWMRPPEICRNSHCTAKFYVNGPSRFDLVQGELGDCWVLASLAALASNPSLLHKVIPYPTEPSFDPESPLDRRYAGIFRFRFFYFGEWVDVCVDDRLPVFQDTYQDRLLMVHSGAKNEFWGALIEKAYAKLYGCYESLKAGICSDALTDFTGGVCEGFRLKDGDIGDLDVILERAVHRNALICTGIWGDGRTNTVLPNGLVTGHAYTVTGFERLYVHESKDICLIRIRNPWGNRVEWRGAWSDRSLQWKFVSELIREELEHRLRDDGEFWMDLRDFQATFDDVDICNIVPDTHKERNVRRWRMSTFHGEWHSGASAGGRMKYSKAYFLMGKLPQNATFAMNPQFGIRIRDEGDRDKLANVVVELTQKIRRRQLRPNLNIGFCIFRMEGNADLPLSYSYFMSQERVGSVDYFSNLRAVTKRFYLFPGRYVVVPSTWEPNQAGDFMLRVWSEAPPPSDDRIFRFTPAENGERKENGKYWNDLDSIDEVIDEKDEDEKNFEEKAESLEDSIFNLMDSEGSSEAGSDVKSGTGAISSTEDEDYEEPYSNDEIDKQMNPMVKGAALKFFRAVAGRDMALSAFELQRGLNSLYSRSPKYYFSIECCKSLIVFVDKRGTDRFRLSWRQFRLLYRFLNLWSKVFHTFDSAKDGHLSLAQFQKALCSLGYEGKLQSRPAPRGKESDEEKKDLRNRKDTLTPIQRALEFNFSDEMGRVSYSSFIHAVVKLQRALDEFDGCVNMTRGEWLYSAVKP